jgi:hypothetical protein
MELDKLDEARQIFRDFTNADASIKDYADWYLALSYLKVNDKVTTQRILQNIRTNSSLYSQAQELLVKINK